MSDEELAALEEAPPEEVEEGAPLWMATFGDMMSLLLVFFILLYSMSELRQERFVLASQSLSDAMGSTNPVQVPDPKGMVVDPLIDEMTFQNAGPTEQPEAGEGSDEWVETFADAYLEMIAKQLQEFVEENELEELVRVVREGEGVFLRIETVALFGSGDAVIEAEGVEILNYLSEITRELGVPVSISGHADNVPIRTAQFASNWELSAARAAGVARVLVEAGQSPTEVRVESYGEFKPVADNSTREGRAQNRRVELFYDRDEVRAAARAWSLEGEDPNGMLGDDAGVGGAGDIPATEGSGEG